MSPDPIRYCDAISAAMAFLVRVFVLSVVLTRASQAVIIAGASVMQRGRGARRLRRGFLQKGFDPRDGGGRGGQGTEIGSMVPEGVGWTGPWIKIKSDSDSRPRSYRSCAAGGCVGWRYKASSKMA